MMPASVTSLASLDTVGKRYQAVFSILCAMETTQGPGVKDKLGTLDPQTYAAATGIPSLAAPCAGFTCEGHRLACSMLDQPGLVAAAPGSAEPSAAALRRRLLSLYAGHLDQRRRFARKRHVDRNEMARIESDVLAGALSVMPVRIRPPGLLDAGRDLVVRAGILHGKSVWSRPAPYRHPDIAAGMAAVLEDVAPAFLVEGFVTASGCFLGCDEALRVATALRQAFIREPDPRRLSTEDLW